MAKGRRLGACLLVILLGCLEALGQSSGETPERTLPGLEIPDSTIYALSEVDSLPQWPGGSEALLATLDSLVQYSPRRWAEEALQREHYGFVVVRLVIEADGRMTQLGIYRSLEPRLDREALGFVALLPRWRPAIRQGRAVRVGYYLPVRFSPKTPLTDRAFTN